MTAVEEGKTVGQRALKLQVSFTFMFYSTLILVKVNCMLSDFLSSDYYARFLFWCTFSEMLTFENFYQARVLGKKQVSNTLQNKKTRCNALQRTATHCHALGHTAAHGNTL